MSQERKLAPIRPSNLTSSKTTLFPAFQLPTKPPNEAPLIPNQSAMCQYRPYIHNCQHGTLEKPANHLVDTCKTPASPGSLCQIPVFLHRPIDSGLPCWTCHQKRMKEFSMTPNIWKYMMILEKLVSSASEVKDMMPELRHYYALMNAAHVYSADGDGRSVTPNKWGEPGDEMDSPSYWNSGITDLLKLVGVANSTDKIKGTEDTVVGHGLRQRGPRLDFLRQPVMNAKGFTFEGEDGARVDMIERASDYYESEDF